MSAPEIEDEVRQALRDLVEQTGAVAARITEHDEQRSGVPARTMALGGGEYLRVELGTRTSHEHDLDAAFERVIRQLRAIRRRWEIARLPEITVAPGVVPTKNIVIDRISTYLRGLAGIDRAQNAFVARAGKLIASAREPDELEQSRWPFLVKRALSTHAPGSSYGEVLDPDAYAMSFWYDCALVVLLTEPYAIDFVRHRCRQVARELVHLLPMLEPDPEAPAAVRRRPPTIP